ncbi:uncharacterized protein ATC70_001779 [Mucor velutinosus]|uniref:Cytochrome P450 n=1 Tax=Mucor velutinosus TaxID=708070 RepID=A0AAN7HZW7_9FUNG|nr:hypothetical protein ATC70_001779 [Mucor velutinosus]
MFTSTYFLERFQKSRFNKDPILPVITVATAATLIYTTCKFISHKQQQKQNTAVKEIPSPKCGYPYIGHMWSFGPLPGKTLWIVVDDPELAHKIFVTHGADTSYRPYTTYSSKYFSNGARDIAFSQPGKHWDKNRVAALSVLAPKQIKNYLDSIYRETSDLTTRLLESTKKNGYTDPYKHNELCFLNVVFKIVYGKRFDAVDDAEFLQVIDMIETSMTFLALEKDMPDFLPIVAVFDYFAGTQAKMKHFTDTIRNPAFTRFVKEALLRDGPNVVKSLKEDGFDLPDEDILVLLDKGFNNAALLTYLSLSLSLSLRNLAIMCHYPDLQERVSHEIDKPTTYLGLSHTADKDIEVDGYVLPKGCTIIASMDSMHENPKQYPVHPESFLPERYMNNMKTMQAAVNGKLDQRDHFNFSFGRRLCIGIYLAEVELFNAFIQVFARCKIEPISKDEYPDISTARENAGLNILPPSYKVKFIKRQDALLHV